MEGFESAIELSREVGQGERGVGGEGHGHGQGDKAQKDAVMGKEDDDVEKGIRSWREDWTPIYPPSSRPRPTCHGTGCLKEGTLS